MVSKALGAAVAATLGLGCALPAHAQMVTSQTTVTNNPATSIQPVVGPTRFFIIPRADLLPAGQAVTSANLQLSTSAPVGVAPGLGARNATSPGLGLGFGYTGNALSLSNEMTVGPALQLDTGLSAFATTPWMGSLNVAGKLGLAQMQFGSPINFAGIGGVALNLDANGVPSLGFTLGVPISTTVGLTPMNRFTLAAYPNWGTGLMTPGTPAAAFIPTTRFALGLGGALTLTDTLALIADTSLLPGGAWAAEGSDLGVRFGYSPNVTFDLYAGLPGNYLGAPVGAPLNIGAGLNWQY